MSAIAHITAGCCNFRCGLCLSWWLQEKDTCLSGQFLAMFVIFLTTLLRTYNRAHFIFVRCLSPVIAGCIHSHSH